MRLMTDAIDARGYFDPRYTCDVDNSSPELRWADPPEGTRGFAVIADDPDAPGGLFTHWLVYAIPSEISHLPAGMPAQESLPNGIRQGINSAHKLGYSGPCPPPRDRAHRYILTLYALNAAIDLPSRATREELLRAISPHILATTDTTGRYERHMQQSA